MMLEICWDARGASQGAGARRRARRLGPGAALIAIACAGLGCGSSLALDPAEEPSEDETTSAERVELCSDGLDNDLNGEVDEICPCEPGAVQACYTGRANTRGHGPCTDGTQTCTASGGRGKWGPCEGSTLPQGEDLCGDGIDQDCNGRVDDGPWCDGGGDPDAVAGLCQGEYAVFCDAARSVDVGREGDGSAGADGADGGSGASSGSGDDYAIGSGGSGGSSGSGDDYAIGSGGSGGSSGSGDDYAIGSGGSGGSSGSGDGYAIGGGQSGSGGGSQGGTVGGSGIFCTDCLADLARAIPEISVGPLPLDSKTFELSTCPGGDGEQASLSQIRATGTLHGLDASAGNPWIVIDAAVSATATGKLRAKGILCKMDADCNVSVTASAVPAQLRVQAVQTGSAVTIRQAGVDVFLTEERMTLDLSECGALGTAAGALWRVIAPTLLDSLREKLADELAQQVQGLSVTLP